MDDDLRLMWDDINISYFDGQLTPPRDIDWHVLSGEEGIGAFGVFLPRIDSIGIDERFKYDPDAVRAGNVNAKARLETVCRLILHEMIHQAQYQKKLSSPGSHGASFVAEATRIAPKLGIPPPTPQAAGRWPDLVDLLVRHGI